MEVLNFLDYIRLMGRIRTKDIRDYTDTFIKFIHFCNFFVEPAFYSQKFEPELIPKYFKGWQEKWRAGETIRYQYENKLPEILIIEGKKIEYCNELYTQGAYPKPQTLDDFINDCKRYGIKLEWNIPEQTDETEEKITSESSDF